LCAVANLKIYEQFVVTIVHKKLEEAGNIFLFDDIQRCGNERVLEVSAYGCWELSNGSLYVRATNECSNDLGCVNAGSQIDVPATVSHVTISYFCFSCARTVPQGGVWKLIVLLKLLKSFSGEEFERNFDCLIN
jgi:hypothetical protein